MKTILTVDDSRSIRRLLSMTLLEAGYTIVEAASGDEALAKAAGISVDLFITDLYMPDMDGIELVRKLRALPQFKLVPILMLTTDANPEVKLEGKAAGATGWIVKPFNPPTLLSIVNKVMMASVEGQGISQ